MTQQDSDNKEAEPTAITIRLTERELEILNLIKEGLSNPEIAKTLSIHSKTVDNHVSSFLKKLKVKNRTAAITTAIRNSLISID